MVDQRPGYRLENLYVACRGWLTWNVVVQLRLVRLLQGQAVPLAAEEVVLDVEVFS